jgi:hypothetical protein
VTVLWRKAPAVLLRYPAVLAAVLAFSLLAALAAAAGPFVRAGVESESLHSQLAQVTPLAAGLEIRGEMPYAPVASRRPAIDALARTIPGVGPPVLTTWFLQEVAYSAHGQVEVEPMARDGAVAHVRHLASAGGPGVWISDRDAQVLGVQPGDTIRLPQIVAFAHTTSLKQKLVPFRVAGVYRALDRDLGNPYWQNFTQDIRSRAPDPPPLPSFLFMSPRDLDRLVAPGSSPNVLVPEGSRLGVQAVVAYELPVEPHGLSLAAARGIRERFADVRRRLASPDAPLARSLGCVEPCSVTSSLDASLLVAANDVAAIGATVSLLTACAILIALAIAVAAGTFLVRRRRGEAFLLYARGEATAAFSVRTALEGLPATVAGAAAGFGLALAGLSLLAPGGTIDGGTVRTGLWHAALGTAAALVAFALGAAVAFPRRAADGHLLRRLRRVPWELIPIAAAAALLGQLASGGGIVHDQGGTAHPRLTVFLVPVLAAGGLAGLAVRLVRRALAGRGEGVPAWVLLALRRVAAARGLLVAVTVTAAAAFAALTYALTLSATLSQSAAEKAYLGNGSDVAGVVDVGATPPKGFPYPIAIVGTNYSDMTTADGTAVEVIDGDPRALANAIRWDSGWGPDPRPLLTRLERPAGRRLAAIATTGLERVRSLEVDGTAIPVDVVATTPAFPGTTAGTPALVVSSAGLRTAVERAGLSFPLGGAIGYAWVRGPVAPASRALTNSALAAFYVTGVAHILDSGPVRATTRSYRLLRVVAGAAGGLSLLALLLYLQARRRTQLIASALLQRMGLANSRGIAAVAIEAAGIALCAGVVGAAVALATAAPIVHHLDPLPALAPPPVLVVPWIAVAAAVAAFTAAAGVLGALVASIVPRAAVAEALRVA